MCKENYTFSFTYLKGVEHWKVTRDKRGGRIFISQLTGHQRCYADRVDGDGHNLEYYMCCD